jgi:hypothetical protein
VQIRTAINGDLPELYDLARRHLEDDLAPPEVVSAVIDHNPNNLIVMSRGGQAVGLWAMLMLNARGLEALLTDGFDAHGPALRMLALPAEAPAAIYVWVIVCPGIAAEGIHHVSKFLRQPLYRAANLYSRPTTPAGVKINLRRGLSPLKTSTIGLYRYVREANEMPGLPKAA